MASNFDFLPDEADWCKDVRRAERRIYSDPASACAKARRALEFVVGEVYERELDADDQGDLFADVDARPFRRWMERQDPDLYDAFHQIRVSGNQGAHHQKDGDMEPREALNTVRSLKQVVWWYVQRYAPAHVANGDPAFEPPSPDERSAVDGDTARTQHWASANPGEPPSEPTSGADSAAADVSSPGAPSEDPAPVGRSQNPNREQRARALEQSSTRELAQVLKTKSSSSTEVEIATAILLNRIRDANDELIATFC